MSTTMKTTGKLLRVLFAAAMLGPTLSLSQSAPQAATPEAPKKAGVKQEVGDAADAIKDYSAAQRDEAEKKAKATLDDMDARIGDLEGRISKNWNSMSQAARDQAQTTLQALRRKRNDVAEWYGGVKHSSAEAWDEVKHGFAKSYRDLADTLSKARKEFLGNRDHSARSPADHSRRGSRLYDRPAYFSTVSTMCSFLETGEHEAWGDTAAIHAKRRLV